MASDRNVDLSPKAAAALNTFNQAVDSGLIALADAIAAHRFFARIGADPEGTVAAWTRLPGEDSDREPPFADRVEGIDYVFTAVWELSPLGRAYVHDFSTEMRLA